MQKPHILFTFLLAAAAYAAPETDQPEWPREIRVPEVVIVVYQPQLEGLEDDRLTARAAVSVTPQGKTEPVFGAVWFAARVVTDRDTRMVTFEDVEVPDTRFPNAEQEQLDKLSAILKQEIPKWELSISLDRLLAALEVVETKQAAAAELDVTPPEIIVVKQPAVLVTIDGKPELLPVENSKLMRVVNTPFLIVLDPSTKAYYLKGGDEWLGAADVMGPWKSAEPPAEVAALATDDAETDESSDPDPSQTVDKAQIIVATEPTELIICDGEPSYTPLSGTGLLYMSNTESDVLMEIESQQYFVLLAGRWFSAASLDGPWSYVAADKLPADFAKIPPESDKGHLLAHIAGTDEATDAVNDTYIPQTAAIDRNNATVEVEYDGEPQFEPVQGTSMQYAVNTSYDVIKVEKQYYCCHEAVWYVAPQPIGPWIVCDSVPTVIYTIPPACPVYPVTYVRVYHSTPAVVYIGYTPGYVGCYAYRGTVVYGTGYVYRGWRGAVYYPRPRTFGFSVHYNSFTGSWGFRVGVRGPNGWIVGGYRNGKYFTGGWVAGGRYGGRYGGWWGHGRRYPRPEPYRINVNRSINISQRNNIYNRSTNINRNVRRPQVADRPQARPMPSQLPNNVFADRDGNVFRRTGDGWQQRRGDGWTPAQMPSVPDRGAARPDRTPTQLPTVRPDRTPTQRPAVRPDRTPTQRPAVRPDRTPTQLPAARPDRTPAPTQLPAARPDRTPQRPDREVRPSPRPSPTPRQPSSLERDNRARQRGEQRTNNFRKYRGSGGGGPAPMRSAPRGGMRGRR